MQHNTPPQYNTSFTTQATPRNRPTDSEMLKMTQPEGQYIGLVVSQILRPAFPV